MEQVARLGGDWYSKITQDSLFKVAKPLTTMGVGVDAIPEIFRNANFLTGNQLGKLGNVEQVPTLSGQETQDLKIKDTESLQQQISHLTDANDLINAWKLMVANQN
jgi:NADH/NAD ratio-sensing transcriptional regulator Rex